MPIEMLFPTPVYTSTPTLKEFNFLQQEIKLALDECAQNNINMENPWEDGVLTSFKYDSELNFVNKTPLLKDYVIKHTLEYLKHIIKTKKENIIIQESWFNVSKTGGYQHVHCHPTMDISAVYYYQTNGDDGSLMLSPDSSGLKNSIFNVEYKKIPPQEGMLILFPSFLDHAVLMNKTNHDRISITFNIKVNA